MGGITTISFNISGGDVGGLITNGVYDFWMMGHCLGVCGYGSYFNGSTCLICSLFIERCVVC